MKTSKKLLTLSLTSLFALSLAACKEETRNQSIPYGSIDASSVVFKSGDVKISEKELYNRLRYNNGYNAFKNKLDTVIYADQIAEFDKNQNLEDLNKALAKDIYSTFNPKEIKVKDAKDLEVSVSKYIDRMANQGIKLTKEMLKLNPIDLDAEYVTFDFAKLPQSLVDFYSKTIIKENANRAYLNSIVDKEQIENDEKVLVDNPNYFDVKKNFESKYNSTLINFNVSHGVILRFTNKSDAERAIKAATSTEITDSNATEVYTTLYNNYYNYEKPVAKLTDAKRNEYVTNNDKNELAAFGTGVETYFLEGLNNEGINKDDKSWYFNEPKLIDGKYYLIYKIDTVFDVYNDVKEPIASADSSKKLEYEMLTTPEYKSYYDKAIEKVKALFVESNLSGVENEYYQKQLKDLEIKIYDPFIENQFLNTYTEYDYAKSFENDYIFKTKNDAINYTVADFYKDIKKTNLNSTLTDLAINKMLYANEKDYLDDKEEADLRKSIKDEISNFNSGKASLNKAYGEENFLFYSYGYTSVNEIVTNKLGESIKSDYLNDFIYESFVKDNKINPESYDFFKKLRDTALELQNPTDPTKKQDLFNIDIDHILISVDNNGDGEPDDLKQFLATLTVSEKEDFEKAVLALSKEIAKEVNAIKGHTTLTKLQYIVDAFNNNYQTSSGEDVHWNDFKTYKFVLKAESLGEVDQESVNNYVPEFKEYVIDMFKKADKEKLSDKPEYEDIEKNGTLYFRGENVTTENFGINDLCATMFGYHMISLNSYKNNAPEKVTYTLEKDTSSSSYENLRIVLDKKSSDTKDDDLYVTIDLYNYKKDEFDSNTIYGETYSEAKPSVNQVFVYYVEYINGSVQSLPTSLQNKLSKLLNPVIDKFKSSAFQKYLLAKTLTLNKDLTIADSIKDEYSLTDYLAELERVSEDYKEDTFYSSWYDYDFKR